MGAKGKEGSTVYWNGFYTDIYGDPKCRSKVKIFYIVFVKCVSVKKIELMQQNKTSREKPLMTVFKLLPSCIKKNSVRCLQKAKHIADKKTTGQRW